MNARRSLGLRVAVVGAGMGGLVTAVRLQSMGAKVQLFEKRSEVGGRSSTISEQGFVFERATNVSCPESMVRELFLQARAELEAYTSFVPMGVLYRIYYHDRSYLDVGSSGRDLATQMERFNKRDARQFGNFVKAIRPFWELVNRFEVLPKNPLKRCWAWGARLPSLLQHEAYLPVYFFARRFFRDYRHRILFGSQPIWNGTNPSLASALHLGMLFLEHSEPPNFPKGGLGGLATSFKKLFLDLGGELFLGEEVVEVKTRNRKANGVRSIRRSYEADLVVSNADMGFTYRCLVDAEERRTWSDERLNATEYAIGYYTMHLGLRKSYPLLKHHTFILSSQYKGLVQGVLGDGLPVEFNCYLSAPSKSDSSMAPKGCESLSVHVPVPNLNGSVDWAKERTAFGDRLIDFLEEWGLVDLRKSIQTQRISTPLETNQEFNTPYGSSFSVRDGWRSAMQLNGHSRSEDIEHLYFVGDGGFPSAGLQGSFLKSKRTIACIMTDFASEFGSRAKDQ